MYCSFHGSVVKPNTHTLTHILFCMKNQRETHRNAALLKVKTNRRIFVEPNRILSSILYYTYPFFLNVCLCARCMCERDIIVRIRRGSLCSTTHTSKLVCYWLNTLVKNLCSFTIHIKDILCIEERSHTHSYKQTCWNLFVVIRGRLYLTVKYCVD